MEAIVSLLVLRTSKMEATLSFYRCLGLSFVEEKHDSGPVHYSSQVGSTVLEIYPAAAAASVDRRHSGATMIGFTIKRVDSVIAAVQQLQAPVITAPTDSPWGRRAVILDPDGRAIEINESKKIYG
jgi:lactoylglutathione lyase